MTSEPGPAADRDRAVMSLALEQARLAGRRGDVPVGAVVTDSAGLVLAAAGNAREAHQDPTAHAEVLALRAAAAARGSWRLTDCTVTATLEPCSMCAGALVAARVSRLVLGAWDPKAGAVRSLWDLVGDPRINHRIEVASGVAEQECGDLLRQFFRARRKPAWPSP